MNAMVSIGLPAPGVYASCKRLTWYC